MELEEAKEELMMVARLVSENLYVNGYQELQSQFATKLKKLGDTIDETIDALGKEPQ